MTRLLLLLLVLALPACSSGAQEQDRAPALRDGVRPLTGAGSPLRLLEGDGPGPAGEEPACTAFAPAATCTEVGDVVWVLQADGGSWQLTAYDVDRDLGRWVPGLQGSGGGLSPTVTGVELTDGDRPEALVVYGGGFDVVGTGEAGRPEVVAHGEGQASVEDGEVVAGDRRVRRSDGRWVSQPAA